MYNRVISCRENRFPTTLLPLLVLLFCPFQGLNDCIQFAFALPKPMKDNLERERDRDKDREGGTNEKGRVRRWGGGGTCTHAA